MVKSKSRHLNETFYALSDPTRRAIISKLARGDATVAELSKPFKVSAPAISKHLRVLKRVGLLTQERDGRGRRCFLRAKPLQDAAAWVEQHQEFWRTQLDKLTDYLEKNASEKDA